MVFSYKGKYIFRADLQGIHKKLIETLRIKAELLTSTSKERIKAQYYIYY